MICIIILLLDMATGHGNGSTAKAKALIRKCRGPVRTKEALRLGIHPRTLYAMRDAGVLEQLSRGVYRLADLPPLGNPDLVTVAKRVPRGVVCLISALAFHEITTQIPKEVHIALAKGAQRPRVVYPPIRPFHITARSFAAGIEVHRLDGVDVRIYDVEKTIADCFKFRNRIGMDTVLEALRLYRERKRVDVEKILRYAGICRVARVIRPYLEAVL